MDVAESEVIDDYFEGNPRARKAYLSGDWHECLAIQEENYRAMEAQWLREHGGPADAGV